MVHPNDKIGPYIIIKFLGRGSFGEVWLGEKRTKYATTQFALKFPDTSKADFSAIRKEASMWVKASGHPNVLPIIEADEYDGYIVIVSEFAPDGSLSDWLKRQDGRDASLEAAVKMMDGILAGLEHLHSKPIFHRDLKPDNILLQGNTPRLTDFGLARVLKTVQSTQNVAGTPLYMSPEAYKNVRTEQMDLWAAAVIFYQLLSGDVPFDGDDIPSLMFSILHKEAKPLTNAIPKSLRDFVITSLNKNLKERYQTANAMREALQKAIQPVPISPSPAPIPQPSPIPQPQPKPHPVPQSLQPQPQPQPAPNPQPQPKSTRRVNRIVAGIAALVLVVSVGVWGIVKLISGNRAAATVARTESTPDEVTLSNSGASQLKETRGNVAVQEMLRKKQEEMDKLLDLLPTQPDIKQVYDNIKDLMKAKQLELKKFAPEKIAQAEIYTAQPIQVEITGSYDNLGQFLAQLGFYRRILSVTDLDIRQSEDNAQYEGRSINGSFVVTAFYKSPKNLVNLSTKLPSEENELKRLEEHIKLIKRLRDEQKGPVAVLSAINERMPGGGVDFKLTSITQKGTKLQIIGQAINQQIVADFARQLEYSNGLFTSVTPSVEGYEVQLERKLNKTETVRLFKFTINCVYNKPRAEGDDLNN